MSMLKILLGVGIPTIASEVSKVVMSYKNKNEMRQIKKDSHEYIDESLEKMYEDIKRANTKDINSIMAVTRFLLIGFAAMFLVLVVFIVLFILHIKNY